MAEYTWTNGACSVALDMRELEKLIKEEPARAARIIKATAFQVEAEAKSRAPVDTGALKNSIYSNLYGQSGLARMALQAQRKTVVMRRRASKRVRARAQRWADKRYIPLPQPGSVYEAIVGPSVNYAIYLEFGTFRMAAKPYLKPAVEAARAQYAERWKELFV